MNRSPEAEDLKLPIEAAMEVVTSGAGEFHPQQSSPPLQLLKHLEHIVGESERLGPQVDTSKILAKVSKALVDQAVRQSMVDGNPVNWLASWRELVAEAQTKLGRCPMASRNLFAQASAMLDHYIKHRAEAVHAIGKFAPSERRGKGLVGGRTPVNFIENSYRYSALSEPWYEYHIKLEALSEALNATLRASLTEGRVLVCESTPNGDRLLHPTQTANVTFGSKTKAAPCHFCLSGDLPDGLLQVSPLEARRKKAGAWMVRAERICLERGKRPNRDDLMEAAREKFDLSEDAAKKALRSVRSEMQKVTGRIPNARKISFNEIREIE